MLYTVARGTYCDMRCSDTVIWRNGDTVELHIAVRDDVVLLAAPCLDVHELQCRC